MSDYPKASDLPVPTWEVEVKCSTWCYGGGAAFAETDVPEHTHVDDVWVKGADALSLVARIRELEAEVAEYEAAASMASAGDGDE